MGASQFDRLRKALNRFSGRRLMIRALAGLPIIGASGLLADEIGAKRRDRRAGVRSEKKKKKLFCLNGQTISATKQSAKKLRKRGATPGPCQDCTPDATVVTCTDKCGQVMNNCGAWVECGTWANQTTFGKYGTGPDRFNVPSSVAISADELTLWVADNQNSRISIWTRPDVSSTAWSLQTSFGSQGTGPNQFAQPLGVAVSADGLRVWVGDTGGLNH